MNIAHLIHLLDGIEVELRKLGYLTDKHAPIPTATSAFGVSQLTFEQWLGQVFLPNARAAVAANDLPHSSQVATAALRHFDGIAEADALLDLLCCFDTEINQLGDNAGEYL